MRYSPSVGCFYPENLPYNSVPNDVITVTDEQHRAALQRPFNTKFSFVAGKLNLSPLDGHTPTADEQQKLALTTQAVQALAQNDVQIYNECVVTGEPPEPAVVDYRNQLQDVIKGNSILMPDPLN